MIVDEVQSSDCFIMSRDTRCHIVNAVRSIRERQVHSFRFFNSVENCLRILQKVHLEFSNRLDYKYSIVTTEEVFGLGKNTTVHIVCNDHGKKAFVACLDESEMVNFVKTLIQSPNILETTLKTSE